MIASAASHGVAVQCRICSARRAAGLDQCPSCGVSESECRRLRRRADLRWQTLRRHLRTRLWCYVIGPVVFMAIILWWSYVAIWMPSRALVAQGLPPDLDRPMHVEQMYLFGINAVALLPWCAAAIALDLGLRRLPTHRLTPWRWIGAFPMCTAMAIMWPLSGMFRATWKPMGPMMAIWLCLCGACLLAAMRLTMVVSQMDRWVATDRQALMGEPCISRVRLPLHQELRWLICLAIVAVIVALWMGSRSSVLFGIFLAMCYAGLCACRSLRRWVTAPGGP